MDPASPSIKRNNDYRPASERSPSRSTSKTQKIIMIEQNLSRHSWRTMSSLAVLALLASLPVHADSDAGGGTAADRLDEVVVTSEKRDIPLQRAPAAISALPVATLDRANVSNPADLNGLVPSLSITQSESFQRIVAIRGVGFDTPQNGIAQPSVAFHIDGVYVANTTALTQDFFDVEQIEVLRGPQGTVYGQNSAGGTINVVNKKPVLADLGGNVDVAYGNYNLVEARGALNVPIGETLAVRFSGIHLQHDGFTTAAPLGGYGLDDADQTGGRVQVLWSPDQDFSALLSSQIFNIDQHDAALKNILDPNPDPRQVTQDYPGTFTSRQYIESLTLSERFSWATLKSISSWQSLGYVMNLDNDRLDFALSNPHDIMPHSSLKSRTWTQEINLTSPGGQRFDWIAGAFFLSTRGTGNVIEYYTKQPQEPVPVIFSLPAGASLPTDLGYQSSATPDRQSWSAYGQGTYSLTEPLRLTGGLRYTRDRAWSDNVSYFGAFGPPTRVSQSDNEVTGKLQVDYDLTSRNLLYLSWSRGFKRGGSNLNTHPLLVATTFKPETVSAFEIGSKNRLLDDRWTLNLAGFLYNYRNYQFNEDDPLPYQGGVANVPRVRIYGGEAELQGRLPLGFGLDGGLSLLHGAVNSDSQALDTAKANEATAYAGSLGYSPFDPRALAIVTAAEQNLRGATPSHLPSFSGSLALTHDYAFSGGSRLVARLAYRYQSAFQARIFNNQALDRVGGYGLWNASLEFIPVESRWKVQLIGTNLADSNAVATRFTNAFGEYGTSSREFVPPRQVLGRVSYTF